MIYYQLFCRRSTISTSRWIASFLQNVLPIHLLPLSRPIQRIPCPRCPRSQGNYLFCCYTLEPKGSCSRLTSRVWVIWWRRRSRTNGMDASQKRNRKGLEGSLWCSFQKSNWLIVCFHSICTDLTLKATIAESVESTRMILVRCSGKRVETCVVRRSCRPGGACEWRSEDFASSALTLSRSSFLAPMMCSAAILRVCKGGSLELGWKTNVWLDQRW